MSRPKFLIVDGCPAHYEIAPYIAIVLQDAGQTASSIYRGSDAKSVLHKLGKHTQTEIHVSMPSISNPEGLSMHDLHSDGVAKRGPAGRRLDTWEVGVDSGTNDHAAKMRVNRAAAKNGWRVFHPYARGVEGHHWGFLRKPTAKGLKQRARVIAVRRRLIRDTKKALR